jgi:HEPN domain-containing protein
MNEIKEEAKNWLKESEEDLGTADASAFYSQQASEKALKALQIQKLGKFDKVHDLLTLADSVEASDDIIACCVKLNPYYTTTRYPDIGEAVSEDTAKELLKNSKKVVEWVKQALK